jgi:hypothetical protein
MCPMANRIYLIRIRPTSSTAIVLYDDSCGPCIRFMKAVKFLDLRNRLIPISLFDSRVRDLVGWEISEGGLMASFHVVLPNSPRGAKVFSKGSAFLQLLRFFPVTCVIANSLSKSSIAACVSDWFYLQVSKVRKVSGGCRLKVMGI